MSDKPSNNQLETNGTSLQQPQGVPEGFSIAESTNRERDSQRNTIKAALIIAAGTILAGGLTALVMWFDPSPQAAVIEPTVTSVPTAPTEASSINPLDLIPQSNAESIQVAVAEIPGLSTPGVQLADALQMAIRAATGPGGLIDIVPLGFEIESIEEAETLQGIGFDVVVWGWRKHHSVEADTLVLDIQTEAMPGRVGLDPEYSGSFAIIADWQIEWDDDTLRSVASDAAFRVVLLVARSKYLAGEHVDAVVLIDRVLSLPRPPDSELLVAIAHDTKARSLAELGDFEAARSASESALGIVSDEWTLYGRGLVELLAGNASGAVGWYSKGLEVNPASYDLLRLRTQTLLSQGLATGSRDQLTAAAEDALLMMRLEPDNATGHFWLGRASDELGLYGNALGAYESYEELRGDSTSAYVSARIGFANEMLDRPSEALIAYSRALTLLPSYEWVLHRRGIVRLGQSDFHGAVSDFTRAIALDSSDPWVYNMRASAYQSLGAEEAAQEDRAKADELGG